MPLHFALPFFLFWVEQGGGMSSGAMSSRARRLAETHAVGFGGPGRLFKLQLCGSWLPELDLNSSRTAWQSGSLGHHGWNSRPARLEPRRARPEEPMEGGLICFSPLSGRGWPHGALGWEKEGEGQSWASLGPCSLT